MQKQYGIKDIILLPLKTVPIWTSLMGIIILLGGILATLQISVVARFIDQSIAIVNNEASLQSIYPILITLIIIIAYFWLTRALGSLLNVKVENELRGTLRVGLTEKRAKLAYKHIENHETWDLIKRVTDLPETKVRNAYDQCMNLIAMAVRIAGILLLLVTEVWWVPLVIIAFSIPLFTLAIKSGKANYEADQVVTKYRRKYEYLGEVLSHRDTVEERTLFGYGDKLTDNWYEEYEKARKHIAKTRTSWFFRMKAGAVLTACISLLSAVVMLGPVLEGAMSIGLFMALVNAIFGLVQMMSWQFTYYIDQLAKHKEYLKELTLFMGLEETEEALAKPSKQKMDLKTIEFKNVTFNYPGTEQKILDGLSLKIDGSSHYAVVGANGSGKTTLTKLLTGLYSEYEGEILLNGKELKSYTQAELKSFYSVVYQDFAKYEITLEDNIVLGNINARKKDLKTRIQQAIGLVGLDEAVEKLPQGLSTPLGKIKEGGQDLSGGQWQRVAMARTLMSQAPMYILDEPTAALDPISESKLYEEFGKVSEGKATLFISHRLGSTQLADKILVLGQGKVIEQGTHEQLMALEGTYAKMYESQRSWYQ